MPSATAFQTNFSAGEISPRLFSRVDVSKYPNACYAVQNFLIQRFGGAKKRGGTQYINAVKDSSKNVRLIPFIFSVTQAYILEFGDSYIRFYTNGGIVTSGTPVEVSTPWNEDEIWDLQFAQSADVLYLTHPDYAPRKLSRNSATSFTLAAVDFEDGPYLEINNTGTTLTPAARGSLTPFMTDNTTPSGTAASGDASANAYKVFDGDASTFYVKSSSTFGELSYTPTSAITVDAYWLVSISAQGNTPSNWTVQGYNGSSWVVLDTRQGETGWNRGERRFYTFNNDTQYDAYKLVWEGVDGGSESNVAEIGFHQKATEQTAFNLTASAITGINDDTGFQTTDVGRHIRLLGSDGHWRWAKITSRTSTTVVKIQLYGQSLPDLNPIINWQLGAWSDETGWPACIGFYTGRLGFARTETQPQTVWLSVVDDFTNFGVSDPLQDDDAIGVTVLAESVNSINWLAEGTDLFLGTSSSIRTIGPTTSTAAFSPTNIRQKRETNYGASGVQPVRVGQTALYSGYYRGDVREISYSFDVNGYVSQDLSILAEHIPAKGVKQMAYAQNPDSIVWQVMDDGSLAGMTYERDQEVVAFQRLVIGGSSVTVESVATIPGSDRDEVWISVKRTINGSTKRYVERISTGLSETGVIADATYLDSYLAYSGSSTGTLSGLSHLEGQSIYVWDGVNKQGPFTVTSGAVTLTSNVTKACAGLAYTSELQTLSPEAAAAGGTAQTRLGKINEVFLRLNRSMGGMCGPSDGTLETINYANSRDNEGSYGTSSAMFTGDVRVPIAMDWGRQKRIKVQHSEPTPFNLLGLITEIRVSG